MTSNCPGCGIQMFYERLEQIAQSGRCVECEFRAIMQEQMDRRIEYLQTTLTNGPLKIKIDQALNPGKWRIEQPTLSARLGHLKHGPGGSGLSGPCDADCKKCAAESTAKHPCGVGSTHHTHKCERPEGHANVHVGRGCSWGEDAVDPLDVKYDGVTLRELVRIDEGARREDPVLRVRTWAMTPAQRAAVSAHWSAELRARIAAAKERDRNQVTMEHDE